MCRCVYCKKNITIMNFPCNYCKNNYCVRHRTPEDHNCEKDYKSIAIEKNAKILLSNSIPDSHNYNGIK